MSRPSLLSAVHSSLRTLDGSSSSHPFSKTFSSSTASLNSIIAATNQLSYSLTQLSTVPFTDAKLVSLLKQDTTIQNTLNQSISTSAAHSGLTRLAPYPDTTPSLSSSILDRIAAWGTAAGMETFTDTGTSPSSKVNVVLGGKVLVIDLEFDSEKCQIVSVKTSFAPSATPAPTLDTFLSKKITAWICAVQKANDVMFDGPPSAEDPAMEAARLSHDIQENFVYLMMLDALAESDSIRWFTDVDRVTELVLEKVKVTLGADTGTIDTLLSRIPIPLPYLHAPAVSFLIWLSPRAYLRLLRSAPSNLPNPSLKIDVPISHIISALGTGASIGGATLATLKLVHAKNQSNITSKDGAEHALPSSSWHTWVLDFSSNSGGGVVLSQTRMRALQDAIGGDQGVGSLVSTVGSTSFGFGIPSQTQTSGAPTWVDLVLSTAGSTAERYNAIYRSPSDVHPPLRLCLTTPQEPGFTLQQVPVRNVGDVLRVLEIVKEQCWLNETLRSLQWTPAHPSQTQSAVDQQYPEEDPSPELLASVLSGTLTPRSIPVTVYLPSHPFPIRGQDHPAVSPPPPNSADSDLFGGMDMDMDMDIPGLSMGMGMDMGMDMNMNVMMGNDANSASKSTQLSNSKPTIVLSAPVRAPGSGLVELQVWFGEGGSATGIHVEASEGVDTSGMEEVVRRGGVWGLPGRMWNQGTRRV
ncbi:hypothetical protein BV22DRAFT_1062766 [Leucogyrophana mollusca]|uniref:Uncharacterized protein n=1 Tax=Leucogyrophana mollusca TaxID=85980 RepID=A0ACB8BLC5_9AGAM|nr:hypothetical protein BV22DRAFT_1062766 [Leucogyrophana mollusca]